MKRRYGLLLPGGVLAHDHYFDRPATWADRRGARRAQGRCFMGEYAAIVRVNVYDADEPANPLQNGLPSYEVIR
jgi:hypothetical protein